MDNISKILGYYTIDFDTFSSNKNDKAVDFLLNNLDKIDIYSLNKNKNSNIIDYLLKNPNKIELDYFCENGTSYVNKIFNRLSSLELYDFQKVEYLINNIEKIGELNDVRLLSEINNTLIVEYLINNSDKINYNEFSGNEHYKVVEYLINNPDKINYNYFSRNEHYKAVEYLINNPDKINYKNFSCNKHYKAVEYLINNPDKIYWKKFSCNNNDKAVDYLLKNKDKIEWYYLSYNDNINIIDLLIDNKYIFKINFTKLMEDGIGRNINMKKIIIKKISEFLKYNFQIDKDDYNYHKNWVNFIVDSLIIIIDELINECNFLIDYILKHIYNIEKNNIEKISLINNDKIVEFLINNPILINITNFSGNENDKAVEYMINNYNCINSLINIKKE